MVVDAYEDGPAHEKVTPAVEVAVRSMVLPEHTGLLLPATGSAGNGFTTTATVALELHPLLVTVSV